MNNSSKPSTYRSTGPQTQEEVAATALGNPAHPKGEYGEQMLERMNVSHNSVTNWGLDKLNFQGVTHALDVGCGGGATIGRLLKRMQLTHSESELTQLQPDGVDISETSVATSLAYNADAVAAGQVHVVQAGVDSLPFADKSFDLLTSVESFYFWPDALAGLKECHRVLKPGGTLALICDVYETGTLSEETRKNIETYNMRVPTPEQFERYLQEAGFTDVICYVHESDTWICAVGRV